jgi:nitroimidazol reductase NimA-like FMN-containing flavoprotein (pyridoxamine 5'-phosphate oxidase superfamily)
MEVPMPSPRVRSTPPRPTTATPAAPAAPAAPDAPAVPGATARPSFRALTDEECIALLDRHHVGRLAYAQQGHAHIVPIHYAHADGWLYGRTGPGAKLSALRHHPWVAFEVDEVDGTFEWRSVVARGALYLLARQGPAAERARWRARRRPAPRGRPAR